MTTERTGPYVVEGVEAPAVAPPALDPGGDGLRAGVQEAFALGWHVAELRYPADWERTAAADRLVALDGATRRRLLLAQVSADLHALRLERDGPVAPRRGTGRPEHRPGDPLADLAPIELPPLTPEQAEELRVAVLVRLTVKDFVLGKAYSLGAGLCLLVFEACARLQPEGGSPLTFVEARRAIGQVLTPERVRQLWSAVKDLKSEFPPYAADPVSTTLADWCTWATGPDRRAAAGGRGDGDVVAARLWRQGQVWRALLSGERKPADCMVLANYVDAAGLLLRSYARLALRWGTVLVGVVTVGLVLAVALAVGRLADSPAVTLLGALSTLGLSAASAVAALRRALNTAERALWDTELTAAIAVAINYVPAQLPRSAVARLRGGDPRPAGPALEA
jgi:hypothetical protein